MYQALAQLPDNLPELSGVFLNGLPHLIQCVGLGVGGGLAGPGLSGWFMVRRMRRGPSGAIELNQRPMTKRRLLRRLQSGRPQPIANVRAQLAELSECLLPGNAGWKRFLFPRRRVASSARRSSRDTICLKRRRCMALLHPMRKAGARDGVLITVTTRMGFQLIEGYPILSLRSGQSHLPFTHPCKIWGPLWGLQDPG